MRPPIVASAYLSVHEAARTTGVHPDRVRRLARSSTWGLRIATADLRSWIANREQLTTKRRR